MWTSSYFALVKLYYNMSSYLHIIYSQFYWSEVTELWIKLQSFSNYFIQNINGTVGIIFYFLIHLNNNNTKTNLIVWIIWVIKYLSELSKNKYCKGQASSHWADMRAGGYIARGFRGRSSFSSV